MADRADATLILLPVALVAVVVAAVRGRFDPVRIALIPAIVVTLVVLTDTGTDFNHLLDLSVLVPLVVAGAFAHAAAPLRLAIAALLAVAIVLSLSELRHDVRDAASSLVRRETPGRLHVPPLGGRLRASFFSEDPSVAVERDQLPTALDSFTLLRLLADHPDWERELVARFDRREFATVVLIQDLDLADRWWSESHLGFEVARSIHRNYRLAERLPGPVFRYRLYVPRSGAASSWRATRQARGRGRARARTAERQALSSG